MDGIQLMNGDCLDLMKEIGDGTVDMVLADPPYGTTKNQWDSPLPLSALWEQYHRICKQNGVVLLLSQFPFAGDLVQSNPKEFRYEWIYEKTNATEFLNANKMPLKAHENVLVFYRSLPTYNPQFAGGKPYYKKAHCTRATTNYGAFAEKDTNCADGRRYPRDVLRFSNASWGNDRGSHPTQKPVRLLEYLIRTYTNPGDLVLDNVMGSGSTGVACIRTGRRFIGIELDPGYYQTAQERISREAGERNAADTG